MAATRAGRAVPAMGSTLIRYLRDAHEAPLKLRNTLRIRQCEGGPSPHRGSPVRNLLSHARARGQRHGRKPAIIASRAVKAILCTRFGDPDDLELADIAEPAAGPGQAVVRVAAVGLNFYDTLIIAGRYQRKPPFPFSPGGEFSGTIESVGEGVAALAPGDRVIGYVAYGAARECLAVEAARLVKLTADIDLIRAARLTAPYPTPYPPPIQPAAPHRPQTPAALTP